MIKKTGKVWSFIKSSTYENINLYKKQASIENNISKTFVLQNKRGIIYLKNGIWLHPRFHRQADGGKPTF